MADEYEEDDAHLVEQVAWEYIEKHGLQSVTILRDLAEVAAAEGDSLSGGAWRDIADAAEKILRHRA